MALFYAYVADGWYGLRVVNVANPAKPVEVGFYYTPGYASDVVVAGSYAYVADGWHGLRVVNIANPARPVEVGFYDTPGSAAGVAVAGSYAYVADYGAGLRVVNITNPANPVEVGFYDTPGESQDIVVAGNYAYVADDKGGLVILRYTGDGSSAALDSLQTAFPPVIDGDLSDWANVAVVTLNAASVSRLIGIEPSTLDLTGYVRSVWTPTTLYVSFHVLDNRIVTDSADVWEDDEVEVALDAQHDGAWTSPYDKQYTLVADGRKSIGGTLGGNHQVAVRQGIRGWDAEIAIPWTDLGPQQLAAGRVLGLNLGLIDDDDGGGNDSQLVWTGTRTWAVEPTWGVLNLLPQSTPVTPTPTGQPAPGPTPEGATETYQQGWFGYAGVTDASIYQAQPTINFGKATTLSIRSNDGVASLLRFDLSAIPSGAQVLRAYLSLYPAIRTDAQMVNAEIYRLKRSWTETEATWQQARSTEPWAQPGANGPADRSLQPELVAPVASLNKWKGFDLTSLVQFWSDNPAQNYGLLVKGGSGASVAYSFVASEAVDPALRSYRPELIVSYWEATPTATPSVTPSPTSTPTSTPTDTPTPTPTPSPSATPTATATPSPTPACQDSFEPDDAWNQAKLLVIGAPLQQHNIHASGNVDYVKVGVSGGQTLVLRARDIGPNVDTTLTLFDTNGISQLAYNDVDPSDPTGSRIDWTAPAAGTYFVKVAHFDPTAGGCDQTYLLSASLPVTPTPSPTVTTPIRLLYLPLLRKP